MGQTEFKRGISNKDINLNLFELKNIIGRGGFGKVWKVYCKKSSKEYAMKIMSKTKIILKKNIKNVMSEKAILSRLHNPFIVNMVCSFQDRENLYLVMDLLSGGDLRYHLRLKKSFSFEETKFILSNIILGLEYIHANSIIHRDIKPENLICDSNGYIRITDFGIAKIYHRNNDNETSGTPGYMAPEVMLSQGHSYSVDFFALGVIGYEFLTGKRPYIGKNKREIKAQMLSTQAYLKYDQLPRDWDASFVDFVNSLLSRKPINRLGRDGVNQVKNHAFFDEFNWKDIYDKKIKSPFIIEGTENYNKKDCEKEEEIGTETMDRYLEIQGDFELLRTTFENYTYVDEDVVYEIHNKFLMEEGKNRTKEGFVFNTGEGNKGLKLGNVTNSKKKWCFTQEKERNNNRIFVDASGGQSNKGLVSSYSNVNIFGNNINLNSTYYNIYKHFKSKNEINEGINNNLNNDNNSKICEIKTNNSNNIIGQSNGNNNCNLNNVILKKNYSDKFAQHLANIANKSNNFNNLFRNNHMSNNFDIRKFVLEKENKKMKLLNISNNNNDVNLDSNRNNQFLAPSDIRKKILISSKLPLINESNAIILNDIQNKNKTKSVKVRPSITFRSKSNLNAIKNYSNIYTARKNMEKLFGSNSKKNIIINNKIYLNNNFYLINNNDITSKENNNSIDKVLYENNHIFDKK